MKTRRRQSYYVYLILINKTAYVGQTIDIDRRKRNHLSALERGNHHNLYLQRAYDKYGRASFEFHILEQCQKRDVDRLEQEWISIYDSYQNGFNLTEGGEGGKTVPCTWNGIEYSSISEAAIANKINIKTLSARLKRGFCNDDQFKAARKKNLSNRKRNRVLNPCEWNGIRYPSIHHAANALGITSEAMAYRLKKGYSSDNDLIITKKPCEWNGVIYESTSAAAKAAGTDKKTMRLRRNRQTQHTHSLQAVNA